LSQAEDELGFGRARRVQGEAFHRRAEGLGGSSEFAAAERLLGQAIEAFEDARQIIQQHGPKAEWAEVTATLAGTESDLGTLLAAFQTEADRQNSRDHFRRAISLYSEAFDDLKREEDRQKVRVYVYDALQSLISSSPESEDAWLGLTTVIRVFGSRVFSVEYHKLLTPIINYILHKADYSFTDFILLFGVDNTNRIIDLLTEFIASLELSESEAASALNAAFRRLGWSGRLVVQQVPDIGGPTAQQAEARPVTAEELFGNVPPALQSKPRQKYVFETGLLDNPEAFKIAQRIANARNYKVRNRIPLTPKEDAHGLMANSFVNQARSRQRRNRAGEPSGS
jgi:hypothetical protein